MSALDLRIISAKLQRINDACGGSRTKNDEEAERNAGDPFVRTRRGLIDELRLIREEMEDVGEIGEGEGVRERMNVVQRRIAAVKKAATEDLKPLASNAQQSEVVAFNNQCRSTERIFLRMAQGLKGTPRRKGGEGGASETDSLIRGDRNRIHSRSAMTDAERQEFNVFMEEVSEKDAEMEAALDRILESVGGLKEKAQVIDSELDKQGKMISKIEVDADVATAKIEGLNNTISKAVQQIKGFNMCLYFTLAVFILAMIGVLKITFS